MEYNLVRKYNSEIFSGERGVHADDPALLDGDAHRALHPREAPPVAAAQVQT